MDIEPDASEQRRSLRGTPPDDPETSSDATDVVAVAIDSGVSVQAAVEVIRSLPGVLSVTFEPGSGTVRVRRRRALVSDQELEVAAATATEDPVG